MNKLTFLILTTLLILCCGGNNGQESNIGDSTALNPKIEKLEKLLNELKLVDFPFKLSDEVIASSEEVSFNYTEFMTNNQDISKDLTETMLKFPAYDNFYMIIASYWDSGSFANLMTISKNGDLIAENEVLAMYGTDEENVSTETTFKNKFEFTSTSQNYISDESGECTKKYIKQYKIENDGKIVQLSKDSIIDDQRITKKYFITNDGIADLKLGMKIDEVKSLLPDFEIEHRVFEDSNESKEFYILKKDDKEICSYEPASDNTINSIFISSAFKTKKGIGQSSTVDDIKKVYKINPFFIEDGAEGAPLMFVSVKELPDVKMLLDYEVPDNYYENEQKVLKSVPKTAKVTGIYIERLAN